MPSTHPVRLAVAPIRPTLQFSGVGESDTSVSAEKQRPPRPPRTNNNIPLGKFYWEVRVHNCMNQLLSMLV